jgi:hypothetical protein
MTTKAEYAAAAVAVKHHVDALIQRMVPPWAVSMAQGYETPDLISNIANAAVDAAAAARASTPANTGIAAPIPAGNIDPRLVTTPKGSK